MDRCAAKLRRGMGLMEDHAMAKFDLARQALVGHGGSLAVRDDD